MKMRDRRERPTGWRTRRGASLPGGRAWTNLFLVLAISSTCVAKGILPVMVYRRGVTNEQIDGILAKHPDAQLRITAQDWRGMRYELYRFHNMTNYVELIGGSNDCARVLLQLHEATETLTASNATLARVAGEWQSASEEWQATAEAWQGQYDTATNNLAAALADYTSASNRAERAEAWRDSVVAWAIQQRDKAVLPTTKAIWQEIIDKLEGK